MEKIKNDSKKVVKNKNKKQKEHHRHNHKRLSVDKMNTRFMDFIRKTKKSNNDQSMEDIKLSHINKSIKDGEKTEIKIDKKEILKRSSSNLSPSKIEKEYYKDIIEKLKLSKKDKNNKGNNIKYKVVDYNIIINNNKTNYYCKGNNINNELTFTSDKNEIKNIQESYINNDMEGIPNGKTEKRKIENKIFTNKDSCKNNFTENKIDINNKNIEIKNKYNFQKEYLNNDIAGINEDNFNKNQIIKENENLSNTKKDKTNKNINFEEKEINLKETKNSNISSIKSKNVYEKKIKQKPLNEKELKPKIPQDKMQFMNKIKLYLSNYIHLDNLLETFPGGFNYLQNKFIYLDVSHQEEEFKSIYNQKNFYKSPEVKEFFRKGIPIKYLQKFIRKLLNLNNCKENYDFKYSMIFKDLDTNNIGDYVPYYYGKDITKLSQILPIHYLNEEGIKQLKIIMWLISDLVPKIEYSPFLVKICSILLLIFEKEEAFEAMRTLIDMNYDPKDIYKLRWHFRYSYAENEKLVETITYFLEDQSENVKELFKIFKKKGLDPLVLINDFVESLFLNFLNFYGILRFISIFLYEGVKALYRISFGILNYIYEKYLEEIKSFKKDLLPKLRSIIFNTFDYNKIFEEAFNIQVSRFNNGYIKNEYGEDIEELEIPYECSSKYYEPKIDNESNSQDSKIKEKENQIKIKSNYISNFYIPSIEPKSNILTGKYIFKLWPKLPKKFRNNNLATIYSLSRKKVNMKSILELCKKYPKNLNILILIETEQEELFGIILPQILEDTGEEKYIKLEKCYLLDFLPKINIYKDNNEIICENMLCCNKKGLWFCKEKEGDLIFIDGTLDEGKTCKNNTYFGNIILTKKRNFLIKDFEIIAFVPNNI